MYKGTIKIDGKEVKVTDVEAIDKGVDTYFKGAAAQELKKDSRGELHLVQAEGGEGNLVIKNALITKGGTEFEGYGQE
ncbi:MAG: hypothetical protein LBR90_02775 [Elusimicrobiota bacterium]|jgi:hypothetical protein|nr:hypothetical protein [Elusimicrobiota bacterium]